MLEVACLKCMINSNLFGTFTFHISYLFFCIDYMKSGMEVSKFIVFQWTLKY